MMGHRDPRVSLSEVRVPLEHALSTARTDGRKDCYSKAHADRRAVFLCYSGCKLRRHASPVLSATIPSYQRLS